MWADQATALLAVAAKERDGLKAELDRAWNSATREVSAEADRLSTALEAVRVQEECVRAQQATIRKLEQRVDAEREARLRADEVAATTKQEVADHGEAERELQQRFKQLEDKSEQMSAELEQARAALAETARLTCSPSIIMYYIITVNMLNVAFIYRPKLHFAFAFKLLHEMLSPT